MRPNKSVQQTGCAERLRRESLVRGQPLPSVVILPNPVARFHHHAINLLSEDTLMITGITATVFVSDMDRAVDFYTKTLGLPLTERYGNEYAGIGLGNGTAIGLHPAGGPHSPKPGSSGSIQIGFAVDRPLDDVVSDLQSRGVIFRGPIVDDVQVRLAFFGDPDGNDLYLAEVKKWS